MANSSAPRVVEALPFIGLVAAFDQSIGALERLVRPLFPTFRGFAVRENATRSAGHGLDERLAEIRAELGADLLRHFEATNRGDFELHRRACLRYSVAA